MNTNNNILTNPWVYLLGMLLYVAFNFETISATYKDEIALFFPTYKEAIWAWIFSGMIIWNLAMRLGEQGKNIQLARDPKDYSSDTEIKVFKTVLLTFGLLIISNIIFVGISHTGVMLNKIEIEEKTILFELHNLFFNYDENASFFDILYLAIPFNFTWAWMIAVAYISGFILSQRNAHENSLMAGGLMGAVLGGLFASCIAITFDQWFIAMQTGIIAGALIGYSHSLKHNTQNDTRLEWGKPND